MSLIIPLNIHCLYLNFYMSQITWTYVDDDGYSHNVGLFHGDNSGHLVVYCNSRIVVIDLKVLTSKNYSFFIDE